MPRSSVGSAERPFAHLAEHLIALRRTARLPQRALAQAASVSRGAVQRAESGTAAPSPAVLDAYVRACGGRQEDLNRARRLRARGRTAQRDRLRHLQAPAPALIHTADDLGAALAAAYERAGAHSLSDARLTPGRTPLPRTTAWRIVKRRKLPPTAEQLVTFLTTCGISPAEQRPYIAAYDRITAGFDARPTPPHVRRMTGLGRRGSVPLVAGGRYELQALAARASNSVLHLPSAALGKVMSHWVEEARRNGISEVRLFDFAVELPELCIRTADSRVEVYQLKDEQHRPEQPPPPALIASAPPPLLGSVDPACLATAS